MNEQDPTKICIDNVKHLQRQPFSLAALTLVLVNALLAKGIITREDLEREAEKFYQEKKGVPGESGGVV